MIVKLLTENHLEFRTLKGCCRGSSESTLVKISNCWKSHAAAHIYKKGVYCRKSNMTSIIYCTLPLRDKYAVMSAISSFLASGDVCLYKQFGP